MTRKQAIKKVWDLVTKGLTDEAEKIARKYDVFMAFDEEWIAVEDDMFYLTNRE